MSLVVVVCVMGLDMELRLGRWFGSHVRFQNVVPVIYLIPVGRMAVRRLTTVLPAIALAYDVLALDVLPFLLWGWS